MAWAKNRFERTSVWSAQMSHVASQIVVEGIRQREIERLEEKDGCNKPYTEQGLRRKDVPSFRIGLLAGVRHSSGAPDGRTDRGRDMHYSGALRHGNQVSSSWAEAGIRVAVNLGDLIDRRAGDKAKGSLLEVKGAVCDNFKTQTWRWRTQDTHQHNDFQGDVLHLMGPHELEHLTPADFTSVIGSCRQNTTAPHTEYYSIDLSPSWVLIFLDTMDLSLLDKKMENRMKARDILDELKRKREREYSTECGAVSDEQLAWLKKVLESAHLQGQRCVVFSSTPLDPKLADRAKRSLLCWNWQRVSDVLHAPAGVVVCCLCGHLEDCDRIVRDRTSRKKGIIEHVAIGSAVLSGAAGEAKASYSVLELYDGVKVEIKGEGQRASFSIACKPIQTPLLTAEEWQNKGAAGSVGGGLSV